MKKISLLVALFIVALVSVSTFAQNKKVGVGIIVGEPTGVSLKYWTSSTTAFDAALAWSFVDEGAFHIHVDYIFHNFNLIRISDAKVPFYYGIGGRIKTANKSRIGVRVPLGLAYIFNSAPLDIFLEVVPILDLAPKTDFKINAAIGARYFFN
ncbi:MAG: DUF3996 domain-containing protein [Ignavibacteria bacterium]|nr:DUF3996 domain-containing protein [Ignavibacteria bacterium]MBT8381837.1 DUF3996 domain-containing protein [Ignavibacteria bacterium]MBT8392438.1 DUF3996 domain-containing protein [Ignavibacteria bacterium]NNJ52898.1 DUF3996 domain-containing protein [Ignavibacteriaceae bacterium]NNL19931.1 DUF3996 domain-containing protein [Ignavibacteriaceae bacterium]